MTLHDYRMYYENDYNHSKRLKEVFGVFNYQGCDYNNPNGINIEFKESHIYDIPEKLVKFACYEKDKLESDYIIFIYQNLIFVHNSKYVLNRYKFENKKKLAQPYLSTIRKNYIKRFDDLYSLKEYLDNLS
ncbi:hypothetical protein LCGC14_2413890 [marine sediment metagenome]|uniref:Uncharacterized protein n=1 Tax=marine sediment metagenome TaxID=412755 RepID=A0A0F9BRQ4_9ZZZZ